MSCAEEVCLPLAGAPLWPPPNHEILVTIMERGLFANLESVIQRGIKKCLGVCGWICQCIFRRICCCSTWTGSGLNGFGKMLIMYHFQEEGSHPGISWNFSENLWKNVDLTFSGRRSPPWKKSGPCGLPLHHWGSGRGLYKFLIYTCQLSTAY